MFLTVDLHFPYCSNLKEKRSLLNRIRAYVTKGKDVIAAELDFNDLWQKARIGLLFFELDSSSVDSRAEKLLSGIENHVEADVCSSFVEILK